MRNVVWHFAGLRTSYDVEMQEIYLNPSIHKLLIISIVFEAQSDF